MLKQGAEWLDGQRHANMTRGVFYMRGAVAVPVSATVGRTQFEQADEYGVIRRTESRDYIIRTADLVIAGDRFEPRKGDTIREYLAGAERVYEINAPRGQPPFRPADAERLAWRIHTILVKSDPLEPAE